MAFSFMAGAQLAPWCPYVRVSTTFHLGGVEDVGIHRNYLDPEKGAIKYADSGLIQSLT